MSKSTDSSQPIIEDDHLKFEFNGGYVLLLIDAIVPLATLAFLAYLGYKAYEYYLSTIV